MTEGFYALAPMKMPDNQTVVPVQLGGTIASSCSG
jgi:hypothetical protein